jgi:glycosyltransferase involved in cell wall biosynthesis
MDLIVNEPAVHASSRGVRRYYEGVMRHLRWPGRVEALQPARLRALGRLRELVLRGRPDAIFWTPCQRGPIRALHHVITVHDCINVEFIYSHDWRVAVYRRLFNAILDGATAVVAISNTTKSAILRNYRINEDRISVVASAIDAMRTRDARWDQPSLDGPFVLWVTNALPHKNTIAACSAFALSRAARAKVTLRVVGTLLPEAREICRSSGVRLEEHAFVDDEQLTDWYSNCRFLLSPSLDEGHNLPIAEALACGANVLCSDIATHREFYEGRVRFFDPRQKEAIISAIDAAIEMPGPWFAPSLDVERRSFADVAADYERLFRSVS